MTDRKGVTGMRRTTLLHRRHALLGLVATSVRPALALGAPPEVKARTLIIAGPAGGHLDRWADLIAGPVGRALPAHIPLILQNVGGLDGVTGANRFDARGDPDGSTALLVPGSAALSWLVGETRAKFDPARWVPLWASRGPAVLVSRVPLERGRPLTVAASSPVGPELPALLALDLIGVGAVLAATPLAEAMLVQGPPSAVAAAAASGFHPVISLGGIGQSGSGRRDPQFPSVPTAFELLHAGAPTELVSALHATALAVQMDANLVLPPLTPAAPVALWRHACVTLLQDPAMMQEAAQEGFQLLTASKAATCTNRMAGNAGTLLALRRWLSTRYNWAPA